MEKKASKHSHTHTHKTSMFVCLVPNVLPVCPSITFTLFTHAADFCGSAVLGIPESVGMNGQIDWQAQQMSVWSAAWQGRGARRLEELSQHGQARASQH